MPLQNVNPIETLKNLHHKLLAKVVKILTINCTFHLIICHPQKENMQTIKIFTTKSKCVIS